MKFASACYALLKLVPKGRVTTYKIIADKLGTKGYRAIGRVIGANPDAPYVPCHRVVNSDGNIGGYAFGVEKKREILQKEGVEIFNGKVQNFEKIIYKF